MGRKITILGMGPSSSERRYDIAKYCKGTEIWGLNNGYFKFAHLCGKWGRFFELHSYDYLKNWPDGGDDHFGNLNKLGCPIYVTEVIPKVIRQEMCDWTRIMLHFNTNYFLGSPSLMVALALYEHDHGAEVEELRAWGIDTNDPRHRQQRSSWAWWMRAAHERGIRLTGSGMDWISEYELDDGLRGLREQIGSDMLKHSKKKKAKEITK